MKVDLSTWKSRPVSGDLFVEESIIAESMASLNVVKPQKEEMSRELQDPWYVPLLEWIDS